MSQVASGRRTPQLGVGGGHKKKNKNKQGKQTPPIAVVPEEPTPTPAVQKVIEEKVIEKEVAAPVIAKIEAPVIVIEDIAVATNGNSNLNGSEPVVEEKKRVRGSPRHSPRTTPKKVDEIEKPSVVSIDLTEDENKEVEATVKALQQSEDVSMTTVEKIEAPKAVEEEQPKEKTIVVEETKVIEEEKPVLVVEEPVTETIEISLVPEKDAEEMEALVVDPADYEESTTPEKPSGLSRFFRLTSNKKIKEDNLSTLVNLSSASEPTSTDEQTYDFNRPVRGRRSTRAMKEIEFTYKRTIPVNLDDSSSSLNVTIGSEIHNDSLKTPATNRKRKDMTPESTTDIVMESPKRARLDLSGLFTVMASPVTMLKNRFSRVKLQSSTPNKNQQILDEVTAAVAASEVTTTTNISGDNEVKMDVEGDVSEVKEDAPVNVEEEMPIIDASIAEEATESPVATEQNQKLEEIDLKDDAKGCDDDPINVIETAVPAHRQWCNIM